MTATTIRVQMVQRKDTAANWTAANPILLSGEIGYETDTKKFKIGDGTTNWNSLAYLPIPDGSGNLTITGNLEIGTTGSLTFEGSTANGFETTLAVTDPTADRTITLPNVSGTIITTGDTGSVTSTMIADGTIVNADISGSAEIAVSKLANGTANQVIVTDGTNVSWSDNLTLAGDLTVNGTTTTINTQELLVEDKNIIIGNVATPSDVTADGGGITLKGATDKTINWVDATDAWTSSERFSYPLGSATAPAVTFTGDPNSGLYSPGADQVAISTNGTGRLFIDASGNVGLNASTPNSYGVGYNVFTVNGSTSPVIDLNVGGTRTATFYAFSTNTLIGTQTSTPLQIITNGSERARIDSSGRLLVGTSTAAQYNHFSDGIRIQLAGTNSATSSFQAAAFEASDSGPLYIFSKSRGSTVNTNTIVAANDNLGNILFIGADGTNWVRGASIAAQVDGTPGVNDLPSRLVFSTTADGASSPTERMRITNGGLVVIGNTTATGIDVTSASATGTQFEQNGAAIHVRSAQTALFVGRQTDDGNLVGFYQAGVSEGSISVSGTTVSYNGAHLSRWSQLPGGAERTEILRGTVLSNIDEMCGWGDEDNEQLNRMKVSDVEGDPNVAGVFQGWDDDDDTYTDDFYCAMTGDFIIRIAEGVTVQRGDLLMSAGNGTAKPQDDDIVRSKTVAKVTSTHVTCTYDDGSYCVPCVLMAC